MNKSDVFCIFLAFLIISGVFVTNPITVRAQVTLSVSVPTATLPVEPDGGSWTTKAPMQVARGGLGVAAVNDKIYAIGGSTESGLNPNIVGTDYKAKGWIVGKNEEYDPTTNRWTTKASMPTPRTHFGIASYQGKIYCIGGVTNYFIGYYMNVTGVNEVYDPTTNTWETKTALPKTIRYGLQANVANGKIYLIGAWLNETINEAYDPQTDSWATKTPIPTPLGDYASAVVDDKVYVIGSKGLNEPITQIYDPETDSWSYGASAPFSNVYYWALDAAGATSGVLAPKRIYCLSNMPNSNQIYDPKTDSWSVGANVTINRDAFCVAVVNDILYAIGGRTNSYLEVPFNQDVIVTRIAANEQYTPAGYGTPDPTYQTPTPTPPPTPSHPPTQQPTLTPTQSPSVTPTHSTSEQPTQPPETQPTTLQTEFTYTIIGILAIAIIVTAVLLTKKR